MCWNIFIVVMELIVIGFFMELFNVLEIKGLEILMLFFNSLYLVEEGRKGFYGVICISRIMWNLSCFGRIWRRSGGGRGFAEFKEI